MASRPFQFYGSVATSSGHFVVKSGMGRGTGAFIFTNALLRAATSEKHSGKIL